MAKSVSDQILDRKKKKFEKELNSELSSWGASDLTKTLSSSFSSAEETPTANELVKMLSSSKFGGKSFLLQAPILFDHATAEFNKEWKRKPTQWVQDWDLRVSCSSGWLGTVLSAFYVERSIGKHLHQLSVSNLKPMPELSPYLMLDSESQSFGLLAYLPDEANIHGSKMDGVFDWLGIKYWDGPLMPWETGHYPYWQPSANYSTGPLEYVSTMVCVIATTEELIEYLPERNRHSVSEHTRKYRSGKQTTVSAHNKRTPIPKPIRKTALTDHVVYIVKDLCGQLRYIGEGKQDRPNHVNSGASHNKKINEHYFMQGPLSVEIIEQGLTKSESLAIEKILLQNNAHEDLWNKRDYEPLAQDRGGGLDLLQLGSGAVKF